MTLKNLIYALCCLGFTIMVGGAVYEHIAVVPQWSAAPPASLSMFQGEYGLNPAPFWMIIHPVNLILFLITLALHWKTERMKSLLIPFLSYVVILVITAIFFVPELISITETPFANTTDAGLTERAKFWELMSIVRLVTLMILVVILSTGMALSPDRRRVV